MQTFKHKLVPFTSEGPSLTLAILNQSFRLLFIDFLFLFLF
jgi:hypothetical protein